MDKIAGALITSDIYITDFVMRDTEFIQKTEAKTPFYWIVFDAGTHIYAMDNEKEVERFSVYSTIMKSILTEISIYTDTAFA
jgi:hypothetical protein